MSNLKEFLKDHKNQEVFRGPTCNDLEPRYIRVFTESELDGNGIYRMRSSYIVAEVREVTVFQLCDWEVDVNYYTTLKAIVKNPHEEKVIEDDLGIGVRNAIILHEDSGVVFAGSYFDDRLLVTRPVISDYQAKFKHELQLHN